MPKVLSNGNVRLTVGEYAKIAGVVVASVSLVLTAITWLGLAPSAVAANSARVTRIEVLLEEMVRTQNRQGASIDVHLRQTTAGLERLARVEQMAKINNQRLSVIEKKLFGHSLNIGPDIRMPDDDPP